MKQVKSNCLQAIKLLMLMFFSQSTNAEEIITYYYHDVLNSTVAAVESREVISTDSGEIIVEAQPTQTDGEWTIIYPAITTGDLPQYSPSKVLWTEAYQPYGERIKKQDDGENKLWYTGHREDSDTGLTYMGSRWYNPLIGRFLAVDPAEIDMEQYHTFNRYAYAQNNPYKYTDPDGEFVVIIPAVIYAAGVAITAYQTYDTYQKKGAAAAGTTLAVGGAATLAGGVVGNLVVKGVQTFRAARAVSNVANSGLKKAEAARDAKLDELSKMSNTQRDKVSTVVGAHDPKTGKIAVGVKRRGCDFGKCAEDLAAEALGNPNPRTIEFTKVIRPRIQKIIPRCDRCTNTFGPE